MEAFPARLVLPRHKQTASLPGRTRPSARLSTEAGRSNEHSRLAYAELLKDERGPSCAAFLRRATAWYAERGITLERVLSDNAKAYHGIYWQAASSELGSSRRYTRPYSPWTNGKAEALIKTMLREWAHRFVYPTSSHRARALSRYLRWYNHHRPHGSLAARPPISRVSHLCDYST
jgi:transposase